MSCLFIKTVSFHVTWSKVQGLRWKGWELSSDPNLYFTWPSLNLKALIVNEISSGPETPTLEMNFLQTTHSPTINIHLQSSNHAVSTILSAKLAS